MALQDLCPEAHGLRCERDVAERCRNVLEHENIRGHQCAKNIGAKLEKHQILQTRSVYADSAPTVPLRDQCAKNRMKLVISPGLVREIRAEAFLRPCCKSLMPPLGSDCPTSWTEGDMRIYIAQTRNAHVFPTTACMTCSSATGAHMARRPRALARFEFSGSHEGQGRSNKSVLAVPSCAETGGTAWNIGASKLRILGVLRNSSNYAF